MDSWVRKLCGFDLCADCRVGIDRDISRATYPSDVSPIPLVLIEIAIMVCFMDKQRIEWSYSGAVQFDVQIAGLEKVVVD